jgi:hypothetical protein
MRVKLLVPVKRRRALLASNPIRGIAGAELIADDEPRRAPSVASLTEARGADQRKAALRPRVLVLLILVLFWATSDR